MEWGIFRIEDVCFGDETKIMGHVLWVNRDQLRAFLLSDKRLKDVNIEIVHPGERARIINVVDVIEPRIKIDDERSYFPGLLGRLKPAGEGLTNLLKGVGVVMSAQLKIHWEAIIDMSGDGSKYCPFSKLHNVVIIPDYADDLDQAEVSKTAILTGLRASTYLATSTITLAPHEKETYELPFTIEDYKKDLPKIVYIYQIYHRRLGHKDFGLTPGNTYYGEIPGIDPVIVHPNEVLDGAIVNGNHHMPPAAKNDTYFILNHPVILRLYKEHGKTCNFAGVILFNEDDSHFHLKERSAILTAHLARSIIGADGAIVTMTGEGHPTVSLMLTCERLEEAGIRTTLITDEEGQHDGSGRPLITISPKADAIISTGNNRELVSLSSVDSVIGGETFRNIKEDVRQAVRIPINMIPGANSQIGGSFLRAREY
jgi:glycine reductase complex component B subunit alpha and beta